MDDNNLPLDAEPFSLKNCKVDFTLWIIRFQNMVDATLDSDATEDQRSKAYLRHLPLKLGDFEFQIFEASANQAQWPQLKAELVHMFSDPAKAHQFQNQLDFIKWDVKGPLHVYENEILMAIRNFDPDVSSSETLLKRDHQKRFIAGLPSNYQAYVQANIPLHNYDVVTAREHAEKYRDMLRKYSSALSHDEALSEQFGNLSIGSTPGPSDNPQPSSSSHDSFPDHHYHHPSPGYHQSIMDNHRTSADEHGLSTERRISLSDGRQQRSRIDRHQEEHHHESSHHPRHNYDRHDYDRHDYDRNDYNRRYYDRRDYDCHDYDRHENDHHDYDRHDYDSHDYDRHDYDRHDYDHHDYDRQDYDCQDNGQQDYSQRFQVPQEDNCQDSLH